MNVAEEIAALLTQLGEPHDSFEHEVCKLIVIELEQAFTAIKRYEAAQERGSAAHTLAREALRLHRHRASLAAEIVEIYRRTR